MNNYAYYKEFFEEHLLDYMPSVDSKARTLYESMRYSVLSGGKRLRPVLLLAACDFAGEDINEALPYACAIEYIHTYSLIHDDLPAMDDDDTRRGNPTNHVVYGEDIAILAGDGLLNTAFEIMIRDMTYFFDNQEKLRRHINAALVIAKGAGIKGMVAGQLCDVENQYKKCSKELVEYIDAHKTGALLAAPILAGLFIGGAKKEVVDDFRTYAECIGKAFQISDDILDVKGNEEEVGKKTGKDKDQGKCNYVFLNGLENAEDELHKLTEKAVEVLKNYGDDVEFFSDLAYKLEKRRA